jgi:hypothetical protein
MVTVNTEIDTSLKNLLTLLTRVLLSRGFALAAGLTRQAMYVQDDQKLSVHLMITIQITPLSQHKSFLPHYLAQSDCLAVDRQGQGDTRLRLTPSVIPNYNYVIMVSD